MPSASFYAVVRVEIHERFAPYDGIAGDLWLKLLRTYLRSVPLASFPCAEKVWASVTPYRPSHADQQIQSIPLNPMQWPAALRACVCRGNACRCVHRPARCPGASR